MVNPFEWVQNVKFMTSNGSFKPSKPVQRLLSKVLRNHNFPAQVTGFHFCSR